MSAVSHLDETPAEADAWRRRQLLWLAYLPLVFVDPAVTHASARLWIIVVAAALLFVVFFVLAVFDAPLGLPALIVVSAGLGLALAPRDLGAVLFLAYAAGAAAHLRDVRAAAWIIAGLVVASAIEWWITGEMALFSIGGLLASCVGVLSHYLETSRRTSERLRRANAEIERLSAIAERDRIARDLHDVLGHTLSLIAVKAELAGRLAESSAPAAAVECRDVLAASRTALAEIRQVVNGYRAVLASEAGHSRALLEAAGIRVDFDLAPGSRPGDVEAALAFALREATTNVARYSGATSCRVTLRRDDETEFLEIRDDGRGLSGPEGGGLGGMRRRIEAVGGTVDVIGDVGMTIRIKVPTRSPWTARA